MKCNPFLEPDESEQATLKAEFKEQVATSEDLQEIREALNEAEALKRSPQTPHKVIFYNTLVLALILVVVYLVLILVVLYKC